MDRAQRFEDLKDLGQHVEAPKGREDLMDRPPAVGTFESYNPPLQRERLGS